MVAAGAAAAVTRETGLMPELEVKTFTNWEALREFLPDWNRLLEQGGAASVCLTPGWQRAWWMAYGSGRELAVLGFFTHEHRLVGLVPLYRAQRVLGSTFRLRELSFVGAGSGDSFDLDVMVERGRESSVARALRVLLEEWRGKWDLLSLDMVPPDSAMFQSLTRELRSGRWRLARQRWPHLAVLLPDSWEAYLASLSRNMRTTITTRVRRLQRRFVVRLRRCESAAELPSLLEHLFQLHAWRWEKAGLPGVFALAERRLFYREMAQEFLERGLLDFWLLELEGQVVAAQFGCRYAGTHTFLQGGSDPAYDAHAVSHVLRALVLRELIRAGVRRYDFLYGVDRYKLRWGAAQDCYHFLRCALPRTRGAVYVEVVSRAKNVKEWIRDQSPPRLRTLLTRAYRRVKPYLSAEESHAKQEGNWPGAGDRE